MSRLDAIARIGRTCTGSGVSHADAGDCMRYARRGRILYLANATQIGGGNRSLLLLATHLLQGGRELAVSLPSAGPMSAACAEAGLPHIVNGSQQPSWRNPIRTWRESRRWLKLIRSWRINLIHANDLMIARSAILAARHACIPVVCHVRFPCEASFARWVFRGLPKPAAFVFNSESLHGEVGPLLRSAAPAAGQFVVHNAVDLDAFCATDKGVRELPRVGILANLLPVKGHVDFLQMASLLRGRGLRAEYWVIGEDIHGTGYRGELETTARSLALNGEVRFLGHRSDIPELLRELDVLVCASHVEPFGRCLIEGMACELPVVATRVGGIPEVVEDGSTGILVPPRSPAQLAGAVETLVRNPDLRRRMGMAGRRRVEEHFSAGAHAERILAIYRSVLSGKQWRDGLKVGADTYAGIER